MVGVDADYNPETGEGTIHYRNGTSSKHSSPEQIKNSFEKHALTPVKKNPPKWLSDLDGDAWVGAQVRITTGRMKGHEGVVLRSGNGWVQVETPTFGEVAKRAHELELVSFDASKVHVRASLVFGSCPSGNGVKRSHDAMEDGSVRTSSGRQVRPRAFSDADDDGFSRARGGAGRAHSYDSQGNLLTTPNDPKEPFAPLIHPNIKEARNQYMQKYVKKMQEKLRHRPDLMYWTHMLKASHVLSGGIPDPALEKELARDFMDSVCSSCLKERWPAAKYCWNESCPASPVYYKLTGCPPPEEPASVLTSSETIVGEKYGTSESFPTAAADAATDYMITIGNDACPGDARFNAVEHDRVVKARRHIQCPQESAVVSAHNSLPTVFIGGSSSTASVKLHDTPSNQLVVETDKSIYRIPNSANARAMLVQKLVREGLTDCADRVCGDNWSVPDESDDRECERLMSASTAVSISKVPAKPTEGQNGHSGGMLHLSGPQLTGLGLGAQSERPPLLPSILPSSASSTDYSAGSDVNSLFLSGSTSTGSSSSARISPYLARGPEYFSFTGNCLANGATSPTARVA